MFAPAPISIASSNVSSATGLLSMLTESSPSLRKAALVRLFNVVDTQWHEVAQSLPDLEALAEDVEEDLEVRQLAAKVASRVFFYLEEPEQALRLALESGEGVFDESSNKSKAYVECLVGAAVDTYVAIKQKSNEGDEKEEDAALPIDKLQTIVQIMFDRCYSEQKFEHALGIALEAREEGKVMEIFEKCGEQGDASKLNSLLQYAFHVATTIVSSKVFRFQVVQIIANTIQKSSAFSLANTHQVLGTFKPVANIISKLLNGN